MKEKKIYITLVILFAILLMPMLILSFYNVPSADDYGMGQYAFWWVQDNGLHLWGIISSAWKSMINEYFHWQGRYSDFFVGALMPDVYGCYWIVGILHLLAMSGSVIFLFRALVNSMIGREYGRTGTLIGVLTSIILIQNMPYPVEAFYWFSGAEAYVLHNSYYLVMCGLIIMYFFEKDKKKSRMEIAVACVLAVLVGGGNNMTSFMSILTYCAFILLWIIFRLWKKRWIFLPAILSVIGFCVNLFAPGTDTRGGSKEEYASILETVYKSFVWTIKQYWFRWFTPAFILMLLFLTPFMLKLVKAIKAKYGFRFHFPLLILIAMGCFVSAMSAPAFCALHEPGPGRMRNLIYITYIILLTGAYGYVIGWLTEHLPQNLIVKVETWYQSLPEWASVGAAILVVSAICCGSGGHVGHSAEAVRELVSGEAATYRAEADAREEIYYGSTERKIKVEPFSVKPYLLFFDDITDDPTNWKNGLMLEYLRVDEVVLNRYDPEVSYN